MRELVKPGRYAMFLRKSREDVEAERDGKFETLAKHRAALERLADGMGVEIAHVYEEIVSGGDLAARADAQRMLEDVRAGMWDGVFAFDLQRVTRGDMIDQGTVVLAFQLSRTLIITPQKVYDLRDELDGNFAEMEMLFGRMELARITRRLVTGKAEAVRQGQYIGSIAPYGYDKAVVDRKKTLVPNADAQRVISWFERVASFDATPKELADEMNGLGIPTPRAGMWDRSLVKNIIQNPVYKGFVRWNKKRTVEAFDDEGNKVKVRERAEEIVAKGLHEPIVGDGLWQRANDAIASRFMPAMRSDRTLRDPLATMLVCAHCGRAMTRCKNNSKRDRYTHSQINRAECWQMGAPVDEVVSALIDALAGVARDAEARLGQGRHESAVSSCEKDLSAEQGSVDTLFRLVERGVITDDEFAERKILAAKRIEAAKERLERAKEADRRAERADGFIISVRQAIAELENFRGRAQAVNDVLRSLISRIEYEKDPETRKIRLRVFFI